MEWTQERRNEKEAKEINPPPFSLSVVAEAAFAVFL